MTGHTGAHAPQRNTPRSARPQRNTPRSRVLGGQAVAAARLGMRETRDGLHRTSGLICTWGRSPLVAAGPSLGSLLSSTVSGSSPGASRYLSSWMILLIGFALVFLLFLCLRVPVQMSTPTVTWLPFIVILTMMVFVGSAAVRPAYNRA